MVPLWMLHSRLNQHHFQISSRHQLNDHVWNNHNNIIGAIMTNVGLTLSDMICLKEGWISGAADGQVVKMKLISIEAVEPGFDM